MADQMLQRTKNSGGGGAVRVMVDAGRAYAERYPRLFQMMVAPLSNDEEAVRRLAREMHLGMERKEIPWRNSRELAVTVWSQMRGFLSRRPEGNLRERYDASMAALLRANSISAKAA
jgi:hypothetical protein